MCWSWVAGCNYLQHLVDQIQVLLKNHICSYFKILNVASKIYNRDIGVATSLLHNLAFPWHMMRFLLNEGVELSEVWYLPLEQSTLAKPIQIPHASDKGPILSEFHWYLSLTALEVWVSTIDPFFFCFLPLNHTQSIQAEFNSLLATMKEETKIYNPWYSDR